jgi:peptidoglycan/LPS O-acetylase OafA/YrhL
VLLAVAAVAGAVLVFLGRVRSWLLLAVAAALPLAGILVLVVLFAALGGGQAMWSAVLLLVGPVGALVLALRRPVREWTRSGTANRPPGGRRPAGSAR